MALRECSAFVLVIGGKGMFATDAFGVTGSLPVRGQDVQGYSHSRCGQVAISRTNYEGIKRTPTKDSMGEMTRMLQTAPARRFSRICCLSPSAATSVSSTLPTPFFHVSSSVWISPCTLSC
jgi:hypothetical protein